MRFFEYEAREIVKRAGIPVTDYGFTNDAREAREIAQRIGGPTVIKSQVLTGGRMKAGGVKFADTPEEAESHAREILQLEIGGHMDRKSTRLNSSHTVISYAVFCLKKKKKKNT